MVINQAIGLAMAEQVERVNDRKSTQERLDEALAEIRTLRQKLEISSGLVEVLRLRAEAVEYQPAVIGSISGQHGALTTPAVFAAAHRVSVSTVNRALNDQELLGVRQPNRRWLVYEDQPWMPKRKRGDNA